MAEPICIQVAAKMLMERVDPENLAVTHTDLYDSLIRVNDNCQTVGGELVSRQVIALIVAAWEAAHS